MKNKKAIDPSSIESLYTCAYKLNHVIDNNGHDNEKLMRVLNTQADGLGIRYDDIEDMIKGIESTNAVLGEDIKKVSRSMIKKADEITDFIANTLGAGTAISALQSSKQSLYNASSTMRLERLGTDLPIDDSSESESDINNPSSGMSMVIKSGGNEESEGGVGYIRSSDTPDDIIAKCDEMIEKIENHIGAMDLQNGTHELQDMQLQEMFGSDGGSMTKSETGGRQLKK